MSSMIDPIDIDQPADSINDESDRIRWSDACIG